MQRRFSLIVPISRVAFFVSILTLSYSQNVSIRGIVKNPADEPIKKAAITLRNLKDEIIRLLPYASGEKAIPEESEE